MGIVSAASLLIALALLVVLRFKLKRASRGFDRDEPERELLVWASRGCLIVALLGTLGIVNAYIYRFPNPFAAPQVGNEIPDRSPPPPPAAAPTFEPAKPIGPDMKELRKEHRRELEEFEHGPKKPEAEAPDPR